MNSNNTNNNSSARPIGNDSLEVLGQLSTEIGAGLTKQQISIAMGLLRQGVNPSALVAITQELRKEARFAVNQTKQQQQQPKHSQLARLA
ncbi:hypothetical protein COEREDRAFT_81416 [Coemansia reversa NRRL 1564]|uniref:Uncharacterized protein n=1 Tax=Coemansia reversa (strain ATCC 12441 / NRRL 1564) TaxID=763665 RepID=A0A2G5BB34_COERN|nr:hypothetical protein COEREDRAFT_81416 [Coemansia reversa NRRL 1564]|eukprot:PIA16202.1 hypothetical protein COEREDRAFT_81416 [Coemansia reversa NRRL 1564]